MSDPVAVIDAQSLGLRRALWQAAGNNQPHSIYTNGDTFTPAWWGDGGHPGPWSASLYSQAERTLSTSATVLDNVIPVVYGTRKVAGLCGARYISGQYVSLGFVFSFGEQASITNIEINDEDIDGISWVVSYDEYVGNGTSDLSIILTQMSGWTSAETALWKTLCHVAIKVDYLVAQMPSALKVTATLGGKKIDTTWRSGGSSSEASTNPVEVAYHVLTDSSMWRGIDTAKIHTASWEDVANWCDEDPGDATARWSFNGIIQNRDPDAAMAEVLAHCFATPYIDMDGKIRLWAEMPPPPITGDWSCAGTTVTEDASDGKATTELAAGDVVYVGSSLRTVASITNDDTFVITATATETAVKVREISGVQIYKYNWVGALEGGEYNKNETPDKVVVRWTLPSEWGNREETSTYGSPSATAYKRTEVTYSGCTNASMAARLGSHRLRDAHLQPYYWTGVADGSAADLEPGDVFQISDDVLTSTTVRLLPPKSVLMNGAYQLAMREFDIDVYTNVTQEEATEAPSGDGWTVGTDGLTFWDDLRVPVTATTKSGTNDPGFAKVKDNGSSSTGVFAYLFDASTEESLFFTVQMPHSWNGTDIKAHVHWSPTATNSSESSVVWGLEYTWANIDAVFGDTTLITGTDTGVFVADTHYVCGIGTITGSGKTASSMLLCRVYRDADSSSDDYASDAALLEIDFHYQVESFGSEGTPSY